jgi:seryl-tRNA(Sec) selenium transferase
VEENIEETFSFYRLPRQHHKNLKSTNMLERFMQEIKRRTLVVRIFPNATACLRLIRALAAETQEDWIEAMQYLNMEPTEGAKERSTTKTRKCGLTPAKVQPDPLQIAEFDKHNIERLTARQIRWRSAGRESVCDSS